MKQKIYAVRNSFSRDIIKMYTEEELAQKYIDTRLPYEKSNLCIEPVYLEDELDFIPVRYVDFKFDITDIINIGRPIKLERERLVESRCGEMESSLLPSSFIYKLVEYGFSDNPSYYLWMFKSIYDDRPEEELSKIVTNVFKKTMDDILVMRSSGASVYDIRKYVEVLKPII